MRHIIRSNGRLRLRDGQGQGDAQDIQMQSLGRQQAGNETISSLNQPALKAADAALRVAQEDIKRLKAELAARRHELQTVQNKLSQRENEIAQTLAGLDLERHNIVQSGTDNSQFEAMEKRLKLANEWLLRLTGERKSAEDRAARLEARLTASEKAAAFLSARLSGARDDHDEKLAEIADTLPLEREEVEQRLVQSQFEIVALSKMLQQREGELAAIQASSRQTQTYSAEARMLSVLLQDSQAEADRSARRSEWLQKVAAVISGYPHWWALVPRRWRLRWEQGRLLRKGLFDAESYLARHPDVSASGMDPLRHYIIHGISENRSF